MRTTPLNPRVVALSWGLALLLWPLGWWLLAAVQGAGVALLGGGWIGVAVPLGAQPWALVNEPGIGFAVSRGALLGYWLPPLAAAVLAGFAIPLLGPGGRGWAGELAVLQAGAAAAVLGLAWAPPLGTVDGPAAGLARFWGVPAPVTEAAAVVLGALAVQLVVVRLCAGLWAAPGGPLRRRRLAAAALHVAAPAAVWAAAAAVAGWTPPLRAWAAVAAVVLSALAGAFAWVPRHPLSPRPAPRLAAVASVAVIGAAVALAALVAGAARQGRAQALLWGRERATSNVRATMVRVPLTRPPAPPAPRGR